MNRLQQTQEDIRALEAELVVKRAERDELVRLFVANGHGVREVGRMIGVSETLASRIARGAPNHKSHREGHR